jgi:transcriptional regulator with XRE-family HTH domain
VIWWPGTKGDAVIIRLKPGALMQVASEYELALDALARRLDIASSTIYRIDRGDVEVSNSTLARLLAFTAGRFDFYDLCYVVKKDGEGP